MDGMAAGSSYRVQGRLRKRGVVVGLPANFAATTFDSSE